MNDATGEEIGGAKSMNETSGQEPVQMERGVQNPEIIDLIREDRDQQEVVLHILEKRPWGSDPKQLQQFDEKLNRYLTYILNGFIPKHYPQYDGLPVRICIDCVDKPTDQRVLRFLAGVEHVCEQNDISFAIRLIDPEQEGETQS